MPVRRRESERAGAWVLNAAPADVAIVAAAAVAVVVFLVLVAVVPKPADRPPSDAVFRPGYIISDAAFYNADSMTQPQVQRFLQDRACVPADGSPCLSDYRQDTPDVPMEYARCAPYRGASSELASTIIVKVAQTCRISPKVLLVLLQKEQSLLTRPSAAGYQRATGYACPDTAACDAQYFGFFNQVYNAAWQFREYTVDAASWRYHVGKVPIQFHPDPGCGSSVVDIRDQATANLYNYTPYQPSLETLRHPGTTSQCSTFGNLNFWRLYKQWFGSPLTQLVPDRFPACLNLVGGARCFPDPRTGL